MDREKAIAEFKERLAITDYKEHIPEYYDAIELAIEALQEQERIIKQLEELRDEPLMHCSEDYWEGHYMAAKEAIAIVKGEEE